MEVKTAYEVLSGREPGPEDFVDLECYCCTGQFSSKPKGIYSVHCKGETVFKNFVGIENCHLDEEGSRYYTCPNKCETGMFIKSPSILYDIHEADSYTPHDRYECAKLIVEKDRLEDKLKEVEEGLKYYSNVNY